MTETVAVQESSISFMLPGMSSPEVDSSTLNFNGNRVVRFDSECVLIPEVEQKRHSLMVTKSYSLPLWKRRASNPLQQSDEDLEDATTGTSSTMAPFSSNTDDSRGSRLVIKVPIPLFRRKSSRSPTRGRSVSLSPVITKRTLPSCLVDRSISPIMAPLSPVRRPSLQIYHRRKDDITVPLRACCEACEHATEESLREGDNWHEKFSRGAKRRRSGSLDNHDINGLFKAHTHAKIGSGFSKEFAALSASLDEASTSSSPPSRYGASSVFRLTVDEVDRRRKSLDLTREPLQPFCASPPSPTLLNDGSFLPSTSTASNPSSSSAQSPRSLHPISTSQRYPRSLGLGLGKLPDSSSSIISPGQTVDVLLPDILDPRHRLRSSPIEEEDEAQLFPLPSPRRSPSGTPSPRLSPNPSPRASSVNLAPPVTGSSVESNGKLNSSQESLLKASFSRKTSSTAATPASLPRSPSPLSEVAIPASDSAVADQIETPMKRMSLQGLKISTNASDRTALGMSPTSPKGPRPPLSRSSSSFEHSRTAATSTPPPKAGSSTSIPIRHSTLPPSSSSSSSTTSSSSSLPISPSTSISTPTTTSSSPIPIPTTLPILIPIPKHHDREHHGTQSHSPSHSHAHTHVHPHFPIHSPLHTASHSHSHSHSHSQSSQLSSEGMSTSPSQIQTPTQKRKHSFSSSFLRAGEALREAGADMLKGVSSMSGPGVV